MGELESGLGRSREESEEKASHPRPRSVPPGDHAYLTRLRKQMYTMPFTIPNLSKSVLRVLQRNGRVEKLPGKLRSVARSWQMAFR